MAWINSNESGSREIHQCCVAEIVMKVKVLDLQRGAWWKKWWCRLRVVIHLPSPHSGQYTLHKTSDDRALCINQAFKLFKILLFVLSGDRRGRHLSRLQINISKHFLRRQHFQIFKPIVSLLHLFKNTKIRPFKLNFRFYGRLQSLSLKSYINDFQVIKVWNLLKSQYCWNSGEIL